ncbi:uncharacterized protein LOC135348419 [Halichondria panicea]|uniref:uncharacterized protein LOC135348419 n=1 Tax=Halichondria panicea TaxID=6063 RepID=UPI00312B5067
MGFKVILESCKCLSVVREVRTGTDTYACYTRYSELDQRLIIGVSDGEAVWTIGLTENELKDRCVSSDLTSYLNSLSQSLQDGEVTVFLSGDTVSLQCGSVDTFSLPRESSGPGPLLFHLVEQLQSTRTRLKECERELESTRRQAAVDKQVYTDVTLGPGPSSKKGIGRPKRTAGSSLLNPSIKKRKAATGVLFDTNSQTDS